MGNEGVVGLLAFLSFGFSVIAAVLAIDTYALLRTGQSGVTWRVLIIASVIFALMHALRLAEVLNFAAFSTLHLSEIVELVFVIALTYAFYLQRRIFQGKPMRSPHNTRAAASDQTAPGEDDAREDEASEIDSEPELSAHEISAHEWARLNGLPASDNPASDNPASDYNDANATDESTERRRIERRGSQRRHVS